jgi:chaperone BCS1
MTDWCGGWEKAMTKRPRTLDSVVLDDQQGEGIIEDARQFLGAAEWYEKTGIPYRRGYLLYGPPGCGKTSFCQALAGELKLDICIQYIIHYAPYTR